MTLLRVLGVVVVRTRTHANGSHFGHNLVKVIKVVWVARYY